MSTSNGSKSSAPRSVRRREGLKRLLARPHGLDLRSLAMRQELVLSFLITLAFVLASGTMVVWSREQIKVSEGQVMTDTRISRVVYNLPDTAATEANRDEARKSSPRIYRLNDAYLNRLVAEIGGLPAALAEKSDLSQVSPELRELFAVDSPASLAALQAYAAQGSTLPLWLRWANNFAHQQLAATPLIDQEESEKFAFSVQRALYMDGKLEPINRQTAVMQLLADQRATLEEPLTRLAVRAGFPDSIVRHVVARLVNDPQPKPTYLFDAELTESEQKQRVLNVPDVEVKHERGEVIYSRGDVLSMQQLIQLRQEAAKYRAQAGLGEQWLPRLGTLGLLALIAMLLSGYVAAFYPRIARNVIRVVALSSLLAAMLALSAVTVTRQPNMIFLAAVGPTLLAAIVVLLAYDQRLALFISALQCMLVSLALDQGAGLFILLYAGCATVIGQLRDVRNRNTLIRASAVTAGVLGAGTVMLGLLQTPASPQLWPQVLFDAAFAAGGSFAVGFLVLGILPSVERLFDITTGMTLAELRDPKHPLLRQLQQKAPGTYNHSLQVANIAEAASESIGANGLLVYVGALYHDIGKINKPEYFIENQAGGYNKHEKLSPAMSLLVLVGHVKDGVELAKEYGLPRVLHHFIESHHGTTLVEYFFHAAKTKAQAQHAPVVEEFEFRYPGPKPQTKEAAILMLSDVVESATRTMTEPNPGRIENLVRRLSRKRLNDGQFDRCDLTFRELSMIEESIIKSMCAIYHGRISYPTARAEEHEPVLEPVRQTATIPSRPHTPAA